MDDSSVMGDLGTIGQKILVFPRTTDYMLTSFGFSLLYRGLFFISYDCNFLGWFVHQSAIFLKFIN